MKRRHWRGKKPKWSHVAKMINRDTEETLWVENWETEQGTLGRATQLPSLLSWGTQEAARRWPGVSCKEMWQGQELETGPTVPDCQISQAHRISSECDGPLMLLAFFWWGVLLAHYVWVEWVGEAVEWGQRRIKMSSRCVQSKVWCLSGHHVFL